MKIIERSSTGRLPACDGCRTYDNDTLVRIDGDGRGGYQDIYLCLECAQEAGDMARLEQARERAE